MVAHSRAQALMCGKRAADRQGKSLPAKQPDGSALESSQRAMVRACDGEGCTTQAAAHKRAQQSNAQRRAFGGVGA